MPYRDGADFEQVVRVEHRGADRHRSGARGVGPQLLAQAHSSDALGPLIGHTRAALLGDLALARTTTELADLHALGPGTVSRHLSVLHGVRLVSRNRQGRRVLYAQTALARALLAAR